MNPRWRAGDTFINYPSKGCIISILEVGHSLDKSQYTVQYINGPSRGAITHYTLNDRFTNGLYKAPEGYIGNINESPMLHLVLDL